MTGRPGQRLGADERQHLICASGSHLRALLIAEPVPALQLQQRLERVKRAVLPLDQRAQPNRNGVERLLGPEAPAVWRARVASGRDELLERPHARHHELVEIR